MNTLAGSNPCDSNLELTLYHKDPRVSDTEWSDECNISFSKQSAKKANEIVAAYFRVHQERDKELLKCIFLDDSQIGGYDWFEFNQLNSPHITLGVGLRGNRNAVVNDSPTKIYTPIEKEGKISVSEVTLYLSSSYELNYQQICNEQSKDFSIVVALFNSYSFKRVVETNTDLGFAKILEKIDLTTAKL